MNLNQLIPNLNPMASLDNTFDYKAFIDEGFSSQTKYAKAAEDKWTPDELRRIDALAQIGGVEVRNSTFAEAIDERYRKIIEHMGHMMEEMVEARVYVPRRSWKNEEVSYLDNEDLRKEFIAEMFDILLFHRAVLAYAGVTGEEFLQIAREKTNYNAKRPDHNINGDAPAERDPAKELQGDCASAEFGFNTTDLIV